MDIKIGIIGLGFVGNSIFESFKTKGIKNIFIYDKFKNNGIGNFESCLKSQILFVALPTLFNENINEYDKSSIVETFRKLNEKNYKGIILLKSTVEPEVTDIYSKEFKLKIVHNPEFLSAKTAYQDFHNQKHIVLGKGINCNNDDVNFIKGFYSHYYPDAEVSLCNSLESESMKIFLNSFYSVKVQFFTELYLLCENNGCNFDIVKNLMLKNGWINPMHTNVPGSDGNISYGGFCFPKDTNALNNYMIKNNSPNQILNSTIKERNLLRD